MNPVATIVMTETPPLVHLRLTRQRDGAVVMHIDRADGGTVWQKRTGATAEFFAIHDLTHLAVETVLGFRRAFYGLVAEGWALTDFGHPWPRGPLPPEALRAEVIVGCFDTQRAAREPLTAEQCNASLATYFQGRGEAAGDAVTEAELEAIRALLSDVVWRWHALQPGDTLTLSFPLTLHGKGAAS